MHALALVVEGPWCERNLAWCLPVPTEWGPAGAGATAAASQSPRIASCWAM